MGILGHIFGSALTGGLFGLIGNIAAKLFAYLDTKQQFAERQAQWLYQAELLKLRQPASQAQPR
jgi:F0F1-type ATP synthase assembly protein I